MNKSAQSFLKSINNKEDMVRKLPIKQIVTREEDWVIEVLICALKDSSSYVRIEAVRGLAKKRDKQSISALIQCLDDSSWVVQNIAAKALLCFENELSEETRKRINAYDLKRKDLRNEKKG